MEADLSALIVAFLQCTTQPADAERRCTGF
jgi:hypothetical protein